MSIQEAHAKVGEMIKDIRVAQLTTVEEDGSLRSRPMATQDVDFDGTLWFFTQIQSPKVGELRAQDHVNVSYANTDKDRFVSLSGRASVVRDRAKIEELWRPVLKAWFPEGKDDPQIALIRVDVDHAEYWDSPSSTMVKIVGFMKAVATGETYAPGENKRVDMHTGEVVDKKPAA